VKIDLYQQVASEVEKKRTEKTDDKRSPKAKKTIAQTLAEIGSVKGTCVESIVRGASWEVGKQASKIYQGLVIRVDQCPL
jgi:hypothetical protein